MHDLWSGWVKTSVICEQRPRQSTKRVDAPLTLGSGQKQQDTRLEMYAMQQSVNLPIPHTTDETGSARRGGDDSVRRISTPASKRIL